MYLACSSSNVRSGAASASAPTPLPGGGYLAGAERMDEEAEANEAEGGE